MLEVDISSAKYPLNRKLQNDKNFLGEYYLITF